MCHRLKSLLVILGEQEHHGRCLKRRKKAVLPMLNNKSYTATLVFLLPSDFYDLYVLHKYS